MTGSLYDHMTAVIIVGALFVAAVFVIPNISYVNLLYVDQQQLRNVALGVLKTMFLDTGYPSNWGSSEDFNPDNVERFGLAFSNTSSPYVLDPDKVQRLVDGDPLGYLEYEKVCQLLGLQGYGFSMRILAPFNVTLEDLSQDRNLKFNVTSTFIDRKPIPNAFVNAFIVYSYHEGGSEYSIKYVQLKSTTNELGKCTVEYTIPGSVDAKISHRIAIFRTTVADVATVTNVYMDYVPNDLAEVNLVNDEVILTQPDSDPNDARWIENMVVFTKDGLVSLYNGTDDDKLNYGSKNLWSKNFKGLKSSGPVLIIANIYAVEKQQGRGGFLAVGPYPNYMGSRVLQHGSPLESGSVGSSIKIQRSVNISGMTYIAELTLWNE